MKIKGIKKIISLGKHDLDKNDFLRGAYSSNPIPKIKADTFIYAYVNEGYDGHGIAVWRKDGKWAYNHLSHCSCYGPGENIETADNMKLTLKEIHEILKIDIKWDNNMKIVSDYLKQHYKK